MPLWPNKAKNFFIKHLPGFTLQISPLAVAIPSKPQFYIGASLISGESNDKKDNKKT